MYSVKRERTGRILKATFDHEISTLESFNRREDAEANIRSRRRALQDDMPFNPTFTDGSHEFTMKVTSADYNVESRFFIEEE
ncbi:MAG: hypothetical protein ACI3ZT_00800 [Candidatus Cryptobacteroides sp.]